MGYKKISRITADDVRELYRELREEGRLENHPEYGHRLSAATVRRIHSVFHQALGAAVREGLIARNPTEGIALPKKKPPMMKILNNEQLERFMEEIKIEGSDPGDEEGDCAGQREGQGNLIQVLLYSGE